MDRCCENCKHYDKEDQSMPHRCVDCMRSDGAFPLWESIRGRVIAIESVRITDESIANATAIGTSGEFIDKKLLRQAKTNADRIRAMTDEELAEHLFLHICPPQKEYVKDSCGGEKPDCAKCWLDWLKQEASDGLHK